MQIDKLNGLWQPESSAKLSKEKKTGPLKLMINYLLLSVIKNKNNPQDNLN